MHTISSTLPVLLAPETLWELLKHKAQNPVEFIPAITSCTVLERYPDGLLREIVIADRDRQRERAVFEESRRIIFHQLTDPCLDTIENEIGSLSDGTPALTLTVRFTAQGRTRCEQEPDYFIETKKYFTGTLASIVETLHRIAA